MVAEKDNECLEARRRCGGDETELELGLSLGKKVFGGGASRIGDCCKILAAEEFAYPVSCGSPISSSSSTASSSPPEGAGDAVAGSGVAGIRRTADSASPNVGSVRPSGQVVGWPPVRTHRMNSVINHQSKNTAIEGTEVENDGFSRSKIADQKPKNVKFVKVNMDGMPIGRKVDLLSHTTYQDLSIALEEMFQMPNSANRSIKNEERSPFLDGSSGFVLTYEDKDGDWMLVGDVPWEMFLSTVQRLRIMRASDVTGLSRSSSLVFGSP